MFQHATALRKGSSGCFAEFFLHPVEDEAATREAGCPQYKDVEHVRIIIPGDNKTEPVFVAEERHRREYPEAYAAFARQEDQRGLDGTPLKVWPLMTPAIIKMFDHHNVCTVQQMAAITDTAVQAIGMGALEWREKARAYLAHAAETASEQKFAAEAERLRSEVSAKDAQIADLAKRLEALERKKAA